MPLCANSMGGVRTQFFKVEICSQCTVLQNGHLNTSVGNFLKWKVCQSSSDENAPTSEFRRRERRGEAPRQLLHVDRAHLADQSDQQLNLGDIMLLWNISTCTLHHQTGVHLSSQSSSTTSSHSWLGMLMHSVVGTIAHTWLRIGIGTLMRMISMLVKGYVC